MAAKRSFLVCQHRVRAMTLFVVLAAGVVMCNFKICQAHPQYYPTQPRWDVDKLILSRNGPSTTPAPTRSTTWTTTTLRSFGVETILGRGQSTVDELTNSIVNRTPKESFKSAQPHTRSNAGSLNASGLFLSVLIAFNVLVQLL